MSHALFSNMAKDTLCWSRPFFSHFTVTKLPIRQTSL